MRSSRDGSTTDGDDVNFPSDAAEVIAHHVPGVMAGRASAPNPRDDGSEAEQRAADSQHPTAGGAGVRPNSVKLTANTPNGPS